MIDKRFKYEFTAASTFTYSEIVLISELMISCDMKAYDASYEWG
jgi:hypothetical protein